MFVFLHRGLTAFLKWRKISSKLNLYTNLNISPSKARNLSKELANHKKDLIYMADANKPIKLRRKRIKRQSGTGLATLLGIIIPTIASLVASKA